MSNGPSFYQLDLVNNMWDLVDEATYLAQEEGTCIQVREETSGIEIIDDKLRPLSTHLLTFHTELLKVSLGKKIQSRTVLTGRPLKMQTTFNAIFIASLTTNRNSQATPD
ncbi:MAG: hypothetical protein Q9199_003151 [Rusavskia elegans]